MRASEYHLEPYSQSQQQVMLGCIELLILLRHNLRNPMSGPSDSSHGSFSWRTVLLATLGVLLLVYLADFSWFELRLHFPKLGVATGSIHRFRMLAIPNKGNKTTYELDMVHPEEDVPCSHSLLPQGGARPCWYVTRHVNDPIPI